MPFSQNSSVLRLLASALAILLVGCASASLPEEATAPDAAQSSTEPPAAGPPNVEIFAEGEGSVPELQVVSGERINLVAAASGQDLTYQWQLTGEGLIEESGNGRGSAGQTSSYRAPAVAVGQTLEDRVSVTVVDKENRSATDQIVIRVGNQLTSSPPLPTPDPKVWLPFIEEMKAKANTPPTVSISPSAVAAPPTPRPADCDFTIMEPVDHSPVPAQFSVWGTATAACLTAGEYWITVSVAGRQWLQRAPLTLFPQSGTEDLGWFVSAELVAPLDQEKVLGLFVLRTTPALDQEFIAGLRPGIEGGVPQGFSTVDLLSRGATIVSGISVVRG